MSTTDRKRAPERAAGGVEGLGLGDNAKASLITRGLVEMARLGEACGAEPETFSGLAGMFLSKAVAPSERMPFVYVQKYAVDRDLAGPSDCDFPNCHTGEPSEQVHGLLPCISVAV